MPLALLQSMFFLIYLNSVKQLFVLLISGILLLLIIAYIPILSSLLYGYCRNVILRGALISLISNTLLVAKQTKTIVDIQINVYTHIK